MEPGSSTDEPYSKRTQRNRNRIGRGAVALPPLPRFGLRPMVWGWLALPVAFFLIWRFAGAQETHNATPEPGTLPMSTFIALNLALVVVLTLFNGAFSMAETALLAVRRSRAEQMVEEKRRGALSVLTLVENPPRYIATVQIGITLLGFAAAAAAAIALAEPLAPTIERLGLGPGTAKILAVALVTFLVALLSMVFGEIAPKALALQSPDAWALRLAPFVTVFAFLFAPITALVLGLSNLLVRPFGATAQFETPMITREEFEQILDEGKEHGEIDNQEKQIITNVFDLSETSVRSVMTPRISMTALPVDATINQMLETVLESGHSRIPVYETTIDNIAGIVHAKDLLPHLRANHRDMDLRSVMRPPYFVPETRKVSELLSEMRRGKHQLAIVQDEYAGTEGIITIEDLIEEIVGEIHDEYDVDEPEIHTISENEWTIDGRMAIADVNERLGFDLPHKDYNTVGGLIFGLLGHEPTVRERVRIDGVEFVVETLEGRTIRSVRGVRLTGTEKALSEGEDGEDG